MGFSYKPLFKLLVDRNMKKTDLHTAIGLSSATLAKLSKGEPLGGESIEKLCVYFRCQPADLVQYIFTDASAEPAAGPSPLPPVLPQTAPPVSPSASPSADTAKNTVQTPRKRAGKSVSEPKSKKH